MIKIISAQINSGKTTWLQNDFNSQPNADGFICKKAFTDNIHIGYDIVHLPNQNSIPFIRKPTHIPPQWNEAFRLSAAYSFNNEGFEFAQKIIHDALKKDIQPIYFDEIGPLELQGKGFSKLFSQLVSSQKNIIVAIRSRLVKEVIANFSLKNVEIYELKNKELFRLQ